MEIKRVIKDEFYKEDYIDIDDSTYLLQETLERYKNNADAIIKIHNGHLKSAGEVHLKFKALPSLSKMIELIEEKRKSIYEELSLKPSSGVTKQKMQAGLLLTHFIEDLKYDMAVKEDVYLPFQDNYLAECVKQEELYLKERSLLNNLYKEAQENKWKEAYRKKYFLSEKFYSAQQKKFYEAKTIFEQKSQENNFHNAVRAIYSTLIEKRGVCYDFSFAYSYLLSGLDIKSKIACYGYDEPKKYHAVTLIEFYNENTNNTNYSYIDVTKWRKIYQINKPQNKELLSQYKFEVAKDAIQYAMTQEDLEKLPNYEPLSFLSLHKKESTYQVESYVTNKEITGLIQTIKTPASKNNELEAVL